GVQTYTCTDPQSYQTADGYESGWACFDQVSGTWLLHAQPPSDAGLTTSSPSVVYSQPNTMYVSPPAVTYGYSYGFYPYSYYPFGYYPGALYPRAFYPGAFYPRSVIVGPRFGFGFGFGSRPAIVRGPAVVGRPF